MRTHSTIILAFATFFAVLSAVAAILAVGYALDHAHSVDRKLCQSAISNRAAVRVTWLAAEHLVVTPKTTPSQQAQLNAFFNAVLKPIPPLECVNNNPVPRRSH